MRRKMCCHKLMNFKFWGKELIILGKLIKFFKEKFSKEVKNSYYWFLKNCGKIIPILITLRPLPLCLYFRTHFATFFICSCPLQFYLPPPSLRHFVYSPSPPPGTLFTCPVPFLSLCLLVRPPPLNLLVRPPPLYLPVRQEAL